jgi:hypothetical protein
VVPPIAVLGQRWPVALGADGPHFRRLRWVLAWRARRGCRPLLAAAAAAAAAGGSSAEAALEAALEQVSPATAVALVCGGVGIRPTAAGGGGGTLKQDSQHIDRQGVVSSASPEASCITALVAHLCGQSLTAKVGYERMITCTRCALRQCTRLCQCIAQREAISNCRLARYIADNRPVGGVSSSSSWKRYNISYHI